MGVTILPELTKGNGIRHLPVGLLPFLFQGGEHTGVLCFRLLHGYRKGGVLITELADLYRPCCKGLHARITDRDRLRGHRVICDLHFEPDERRLGLIFAPLEADAGSFVHQTLFVVKESFRHHGGIQKSEGAGVAVPFLQGRDPFPGDRNAQALIVFPDSVMVFFMVVFLQVVGPVAVEFFQCLDLVGFCFP